MGRGTFEDTVYSVAIISLHRMHKMQTIATDDRGVC